MTTEKTPGILFLENLCDVNTTWRNALGWFAIRGVITDVCDYDDALEILDELCDIDHPEVTIDDLFTFAEPSRVAVEKTWTNAEKSKEGYSELDVMDCALAIEFSADSEHLLELLNKNYPKLYSLVAEPI